MSLSRKNSFLSFLGNSNSNSSRNLSTELEDRVKKRKKEDLILLFVIYVISTIIVLQIYRAYLEVGVQNIDLIQKTLDYNLKNSFFFSPTEKYKTTFYFVSFIFFIQALGILKNNKKYMKGMEYGSARWATAREKEKYEDKKKPANNVILAQDIKIGLNGRRTKINANVGVVGGSGSGKSTSIVLPNLFQFNTSFVITDPKGEIFKIAGKLLLKNGYVLKVFNLKKISESMQYNPFKYITEVEDIFSFIKMLIQNTDNGQKSNDPFWEKAETLLLQAIMVYLYEERPKHEQNLPNVVKLVRAAKISEDEEKGGVNPLDIIFEKLEKSKGETFAVIQYQDFTSGTGKMLKTILMCVLTRLSFVSIPTVKTMFSGDELELEQLTERKTALFVIIPDGDNAFNFLASVLYNQLFKFLGNIADERGLKIPLEVILDEMANIGQIPNFEKVIAVARSRGMNIIPILQSISQLESLYKDTWKGIIDNCNSIVFLGGDESAEWMSKKLGKRTIDNRTTNLSKGRNKSLSENNSILGRELMTPDEITLMPDTDCIVKIKGSYPMYSKKYNIFESEFAEELGDAKDPDNKNNLTFEELRNLEKRESKVNSGQVANNLEKIISSQKERSENDKFKEKVS